MFGKILERGPNPHKDEQTPVIIALRLRRQRESPRHHLWGRVTDMAET